ncbi:2-hydroxychromene-2-carboxylate isomerase [Polymorphum gilvum]|uniref:2-hydroxychromene-2-carboxylate isomerase n=1 Tax=Polymorphum gilvum (strain LMG 25793 / CGMCC 1.9160 / SL003B-26A1) TaxID=991905 RepID=F2IXM7_POLGS|nr:2-hydroxychromene-2-carboxylate isomerase [Polymorphum gilvum]ADZ71650.1 2-hydroxychromene-2-carboxylate isomerase (HCCA isomerase) [Polymorphum gilvum SL003B-26A1]
MSVTIDYFYTHVSPWAYLGHRAFLDLAARHGARVIPRPVNLAGVFDASGGLPLARRHPVRQAYRVIELQRWRDKRGQPLTLKPKFFPVDPTLCDGCAIALAEAGGPTSDFSIRAFRAIWVEDRDISDAATLDALLGEVGADARAILAEASGPAVQARYAQNQKLAVDIGVIGSPCYVLNGEPFWGQDRLDLLEDALISARPPYVPV